MRRLASRSAVTIAIAAVGAAAVAGWLLYRTDPGNILAPYVDMSIANYGLEETLAARDHDQAVVLSFNVMVNSKSVACSRVEVIKMLQRLDTATTVVTERHWQTEVVAKGALPTIVRISMGLPAALEPGEHVLTLRAICYKATGPNLSQVSMPAVAVACFSVPDAPPPTETLPRTAAVHDCGPV